MVQSLLTASAASSSRIAMARAAAQLERTQQGLAAPSITDNPSNAPANAAVAFQMDGIIQALTSAGKNIAQGTALVQMASGALANIQGLIQQLTSLASAANTVTLSDANRGLMDKEAQELLAQIDFIASKSQWNGNAILDGTFTGNVQVGTNGADVVAIALPDCKVATLALTGNVTSQANAVTLKTALDAASSTVSTALATLGSKKSRFAQIESSISVTIQNTQAAKSTVADSDIPELLEASQKLQAMVEVASTSMLKALESIARLSQMVRDAKNI